MPDVTFLDWPFFDETHRALARDLEHWVARELAAPAHDDVDDACRAAARALGAGGWLRYAVPAPYGGRFEQLDVRSMALIRETLGRASGGGIAEFVFAMQALGAGPIALFGSDGLKRRYLPRIAVGEAIGAFAISEADAGSDIAAMTTTAQRDGTDYVIDGEKTWISNAGIADQYVVFCRLTGERDPSEKRFIALVVEPDDPGFAVSQRIQTIAPHPLGTLRFDGCRVPADRVVGEPGRGLKVALGTLDVLRTTVGAAALGFARRALDEAVAHVSSRRVFGQRLADLQLTQARIAQMATTIDASALLVYRAAWTRDVTGRRVTREAAMAKMFATEGAQCVIDDAVQLLGGRGVVSDNVVERLYREIRALRIYEGTTEIQQLVIARQILGASDGSEGRPHT